MSFEDRQNLLGHKSGRITMRFSLAELSNLLAVADKVCDAGESRKHTATSSPNCGKYWQEWRARGEKLQTHPISSKRVVWAA
jgi:hypothetical protein